MHVKHVSTVLAPPEFVYNWHTKDGSFERLTPPWESVDILSKKGDFENLRMLLQLKKYGIKFKWLAEHFDVKPGYEFNDRQLEGPFKMWAHSHQFIELASDRTKMVDDIQVKLPFHFISRAFQGWKIKRDILSMLRFRHHILSYDCHLLYQLPMNPQVIAISGSTGLIGQHFTPFLTAAGHRVRRMIRQKTKNLPTDIRWNAEHGMIDDFSDVTMIIHLAGEPIVSSIRWTEQKKADIYSSRVDATKTLAYQLHSEPHQVHTFVCASATGYYPSSNHVVNETSESGDGFLAQVTKDWEAACDPIRDSIRVCHARFGAVLHPNGGLMNRLNPIMACGGLGPIGSGQQYVSWVVLEDAIRALYTILANQNIIGPVNIVSPDSQHQIDWIQDWATAVFRPSRVPLPEFLVKTIMGDMGEELLLHSSRVFPSVLIEKKFQFQCHTMKEVCDLYRGK